MLDVELQTYGRSADGTWGFSSLNPMRMPDWVQAAFTVGGDDPESFERSLGDAGAVILEQYGISGEFLEVWCLDDEFYIEHAAAGEHDRVVRIVILSLNAFLHFQAAYIAPVSVKIMQADQYFVWCQEEKRRERCALDS